MGYNAINASKCSKGLLEILSRANSFIIAKAESNEQENATIFSSVVEDEERQRKKEKMSKTDARVY